MSSLSRPSRLAVIGCPVGALFLLAALVPGCPLAAEELPRQREAPLELLPIEHCRKLAQDWASWVDRPLLYKGQNAAGFGLGSTYVFETTDGSDRVEVAALLDTRLAWTDLRASGIAHTTTRPGEGGLASARAFLERLHPKETGLQWVSRKGVWACFDGAGTQRGWAWMRMDTETPRVVMVREYWTAEPAPKDLAVTPEEALRIATATLRRLPGARSVLDIELVFKAEAPPQAHVTGLGATSDALGLGRARYTVAAQVSPERIAESAYRAMSEEERYQHRFGVQVVCVDAQTGEPYAEDNGYSGRERMPRVILGQTVELVPNYPARIRRGVPYFYVGYLQSALWRGEVEAHEEGADITYRGQTWHLRAGNETVAAGTRSIKASHCPLLIGERLYLPPEILQAITGWHMTYVPKGNTVYLYTLGPDPVPTPRD